MFVSIGCQDSYYREWYYEKKIDKIRHILEDDGRLILRDMAQLSTISLAEVHEILIKMFIETWLHLKF